MALITAAQLAERLGVDRTTVIRRIEAGQVQPVMKLPGRTGSWLFDDQHLPPVDPP